MPRPIKDSVIVITGASSGIGRATALKFAKQGATLLQRSSTRGCVAGSCRRVHTFGWASPSCAN